MKNQASALTSIISLLLVIMIFTPSTSWATLEEAKETARRIYKLLIIEGFEVLDYYSYGELDIGESTVFKRQFYRGNTYALIVAGCNYTEDIDIYLYDDDGDLIDKDKKPAQAGFVIFSPRYSGNYYIKIVMYDATSNNVHWVLQYAYI